MEKSDFDFCWTATFLPIRKIAYHLCLSSTVDTLDTFLLNSSKLDYVAMLRPLASFELESFSSCFHFCAKVQEIVSFQTALHIFISSKDTFLEPTWWRKLDNSDEHLSHNFWSCLWSLNSLSYPSPFSVTCCKMYITVHFWQLCTVMPAVWNPSAGLSCYKSRWYSEKGKRNKPRSLHLISTNARGHLCFAHTEHLMKLFFRYM